MNLQLSPDLNEYEQSGWIPSPSYQNIQDYSGKLSFIHPDHDLEDYSSRTPPRSRSPVNFTPTFYTNQEYPSEFISPAEISRLAQLFGFGITQSVMDQVNQIRNRLGFPGVVNRIYFEDNEIRAILDAFGIPRTGSVTEQSQRLQSKIYQMSTQPGKPYIPRTNPNASPIVAQLPVNSLDMSPIPVPLSGTNRPYVSISQKMSPLQPFQTSPKRMEGFNLDELQLIAQKFGLPTYGTQDELIKSIRACLQNL